MPGEPRDPDDAGPPRTDPPDATEVPEAGEAPGAQAARAALNRARAAAVARGLVPGAPVQPGRRRRVAGQGPRGTDSREPQRLLPSIERLVAERGWSTPVAVGGVMGRWATVVGEEVAGHCVPESFEDGLLTVRADSTAWATQVRLLAPQLLRRLAEDLGSGTVTRVVVKGPAGPGWRHGLRSVRGGRGPRDTYG